MRSSAHPCSLEGRKKVGDYLLCETLGAGTFATVRRAIHTITEKEFAVKCLDKAKIEEQHLSKVGVDPQTKTVCVWKAFLHFPHHELYVIISKSNARYH